VNKNSKVYIAGHRGMVGSAIVRKLKEEGYNNLIFRTSKELDLRRQRDTEEFFEKEKPEYVFLCAAKVGGILANSTYVADFIYDNIMIAANVINSAYKFGVKKMLNLGSSCIYPRNCPQPMKEEYLLSGKLEPTNEPYAIAKISAIKLCHYYNEQYGTNFISVMPTNLYGPNDNFNLETAHVPTALLRKFHLAKLLSEENFEEIKKDIKRYPLGFGLDREINLEDKNSIVQTLEKTGEVYREFLYVDDLADACVFLMEKYDFKDIGEFVNIGTGKDAKIKEFVKIIRKTVGYEGEVRYDTSKPDGSPKKLLDISKIKRFGWSPKIDLEEGVRKYYGKYLK